MKDYLKELVGKAPNSNIAGFIAREYLQARILEGLQAGGAFETWAFVGGTSLRFLYSMPRFSEDLDFSLTTAGKEDRFGDLMSKAANVLRAEGYSLNVKTRDEKTVKAAFFRFDGLPYELGLSPHSSQTLSVKVDIDTNPPAGAVFETSLVRKHCLLNLLHYDKASLLAGKLHALLSRRYVKGRDIYDLVWYLSDRSWPGPNVTLLNNALTQTGWQGAVISAENWRSEIVGSIAEWDWDKVVADVRPFIEREGDLDLLSKENVLKLLAEVS
jgi:predicted nucleotidyltransferase component of viral defense system